MDEENKLKNGALNGLETTEDNEMKSSSFPAVSTRSFGFPTDRCAGIKLSSVKGYIEKETGIKKVVFCLFGQESLDTFEKAFTRLVAQRRSQ